MKTTQSINVLLRRLWAHITPRRRGQFGLLLVLMIFVSFAEILSIGAVLPFLGVLTAPNRIFEHPSAQPFIQALGLTSGDQLLLPMTISFGLAVFIAGAMRLLLLWTSTRLSFAAGADLSISIYRRTLYQPYSIHVARNSSEVIAGISTKTDDVITHALLPALNFISSSVMMITILIALLFVAPVAAVAIFGGFGLIYVLIARNTRKQMLADSQCIARESTQVIKALQEGLGGIRNVLIDGSQAVYCQIYRNADIPLRRAQCNNGFISASPRYAMETLGMILIIGLAYGLARQTDGIAKAIPVLGTLVLGIQRLLPVLQQAYGAWSGIRSGQASLQDSLDLLDQPLPEHIDHSTIDSIPFQTQIKLNRISFRYSPLDPWVLRNLSLEITKGSRVGFMGTTGSGKSTLLDIIMGLLQPTEGTMKIDDQLITTSNHRSWQARIAHVPQAIFLADSSIVDNIAFGVPRDQIDVDRVREAARKAQIADVIDAWPKKYETVVGERGVRLSGGQCQRIGIARALYKQADVIIFDEATSALDNETEQAVMQAIDGLVGENITILIITHRLTTLKSCTQIVEMADGAIKRIGTYHDLAARRLSGEAKQGEQSTP